MAIIYEVSLNDGLIFNVMGSSHMKFTMHVRILRSLFAKDWQEVQEKLKLTSLTTQRHFCCPQLNSLHFSNESGNIFLIKISDCL